MGAWGIGALENDRALDWMNGKKSVSAESVKRLLDSFDEQEQFLGISFVDSALNGTDADIVGFYYEYEDLYKGLKGDKAIAKLKTRASKVLNVLIKDGASTWIGKCKDDRMELLDKVKDRMKGE